MRIVVIGRGVIGSAVASLLRQRHEVVQASRSGGDLLVDARSEDSIRDFYERCGRFDALVVALGSGRIFTPLWELSPADYLEAWQDRVMSQINLVRLGLPNLRDGGSFTLSSGFMNKSPLPGFSAITASNGGIDGFIVGAARDLPRGIRINGVSATFVKETLEGFGMTDLSAYTVMPAAAVARSYALAVESDFTGRDLDTRELA